VVVGNKFGKLAKAKARSLVERSSSSVCVPAAETHAPPPRLSG
jgi:hypothetical protein